METQRARKKKKQTRSRRVKKAEDALIDDNVDMESVTSIASSTGTSVLDDSFDNDSETVDQQDDLEGRLLESIDGASQKSAKGRQACLLEVKKMLAVKVLSDFVEERRDTLLDLVERTLKRGQKEDRVLAATLSCALCIQLGEDGAAPIFKALKSHFITLMQDNTLSISARASCARALGICCFIGAQEQEDMVECLNALHGLLKKVPGNPSEHSLLCNAVSAWGLLMTVMPSHVLEDCIDEIWNVLYRLLEKGDLNLKIAAGEVVALLHELTASLDENYNDNDNGLFGLLRELATESSRHIAKKDKRQQRSTFRDYLKAVEHGEVPNDTIKFGHEEVELYSWKRIRQYNAFKEILGPGVIPHLQENLLLRDIFDLGAPLVEKVKQSRETKWERVTKVDTIRTKESEMRLRRWKGKPEKRITQQKWHGKGMIKSW